MYCIKRKIFWTRRRQSCFDRSPASTWPFPTGVGCPIPPPRRATVKRRLPLCLASQNLNVRWGGPESGTSLFHKGHFLVP
ncbi:hypothetical protein D5086_002237 [Populus alba]|uniref:Uncharacterized protein n=1 Tax=Populus alba TaxID=43335 RepID=A0ACC4D281_POPAL